MSSSDPSKPKVSPRVRAGGGVPKGFEKRRLVNVYWKSSPNDKPMKKLVNSSQGVWTGPFQGPNPAELWIFNDGEEPPSLAKSGHPIGAWGYAVDANPTKNAPKDRMLFVPPKSKKPAGFIAKGTWTFPVMKRDEEALDEEEAGFLHVGTAKKGGEKLEVGGRWRMLYQRPGTDKTMEIHVKKPDGEKITLTVEPSNTIDEVKDMVKDAKGIPKDEQRLRFKGKQLDDKKTLDDYGVEDGNILNLEPMEIYVKEPSGKKHKLVVEPTDTIQNVKKKLERQEGIPIEDQRLTFGGKPCVDNKNLRAHGIKHKSTLNLEPMIVYVQEPNGKKHTLHVEPNDAIESIKTKLEKQEGIPKEDQRLTFAGKPCVDSKALKDHGIKHKSTLNLEPMLVYVQEPNDGKKHSLLVEPTDTIEDVKKKLEKQEGIPREDQRLSFVGKPCVDNKDLRAHGIKHKSTLNLEPMIVYVQEPNGKKHTLLVEPNDAIESIKEKLEKQEGIPKEDQRLTFAGKPCVDSKALKDHGIKHKSTLNLEPMLIYVQEPNDGKKHTVFVEPTDTIEDVKKKLEKQVGIPRDNQRLSFAGKPCVDNKTLANHGIKHKSTLNLGPTIIYVRTPHGKKLTFEVELKDTISSIKDRVERKENIPIDEQRFSFQKRSLTNDAATLTSEGIKHESTIDMEPMHIFVKDWTGKKFKVSCEPEEAISSIKDKIEKQEGHPKRIQILTTSGGDLLEDRNTLRKRGIKHQDTLLLDRMKIYVKDWKGKTTKFEVDPKEGILDIKQMIEKKDGHPVSTQILKFRGKGLEDPKNLLDYGIKNEDTIDLSKAVPEAPPTPPQSTYVVQLTPYKSPLEATYTPTKSKKRDGVRAKSKELLKARWHTDLASENAELARLAEAKHMQKKTDK